MSTTSTTIMEQPTAPPRSEIGITLLEAYSALANREPNRTPAIAIPFPGQPSGTDPENRLWTMRLRNVG